MSGSHSGWSILTLANFKTLPEVWNKCNHCAYSKWDHGKTKDDGTDSYTFLTRQWTIYNLPVKRKEICYTTIINILSTSVTSHTTCFLVDWYVLLYWSDITLHTLYISTDMKISSCDLLQNLYNEESGYPLEPLPDRTLCLIVVAHAFTNNGV